MLTDIKHLTTEQLLDLTPRQLMELTHGDEPLDGDATEDLSKRILDAMDQNQGNIE